MCWRPGCPLLDSAEFGDDFHRGFADEAAAVKLSTPAKRRHVVIFVDGPVAVKANAFSERRSNVRLGTRLEKPACHLAGRPQDNGASLRGIVSKSPR